MVSFADGWQALAARDEPRLEELFDDPDRLEELVLKLDMPGGEMLFDFSKTHLDDHVIEQLTELALARDLAGQRRRLFAGEAINVTEERAAEHPAERGIGDPSSVAEADALHERTHALAEAVAGGALGDIAHVLHVGIGGSALGPALAMDALGRRERRLDVAVVSNIDGAALEEVFARFDPARTLLAVASKTFTTIETLTNAESALAWMREGGVADPYGRVVAMTAAPAKAAEWGVDDSRILPFRESVGGRYSLWSSIGFPIALALGWPVFEAMRRGAAAMDRHFMEADFTRSAPVLAAFADLYYAQVHGSETRAVFAYDERLRLLPAYLQQLEMESNGKGVQAGGGHVTYPTAPVTWGGVGTDAQHAVFQLLHQGTHLVPVEFVAARTPGHDLDMRHHAILLSNCFAQGAALMSGRHSDDPARSYPGDRPSATILLDEVNAATLGALIAFYEHRTFVNAALLGINPFDQFGVELGKQIAKAIDAGDIADFDPSTLALLEAAGLGPSGDTEREIPA